MNIRRRIRPLHTIREEWSIIRHHWVDLDGLISTRGITHRLYHRSVRGLLGLLLPTLKAITEEDITVGVDVGICCHVGMKVVVIGWVVCRHVVAVLGHLYGPCRRTVVSCCITQRARATHAEYTRIRKSVVLSESGCICSHIHTTQQGRPANDVRAVEC